jgi:hypothetical protein
MGLVAERLSVSDAIKTAREQEVLTQQILKDYCMVGMKNTFNHAEETYQAHIDIFEKNIKILNNFATSKKALENIEKIATFWEFVKVFLFMEKKDWFGALEIKKYMKQIFILNRETTKIYISKIGSVEGKYINATVNLEVDSQKMAMLYLMHASWGINTAEMKLEMKSAIEEFSKSVELLKHTKVNTPQMLKKLQKIEQDLLYFTMMDTLNSRAIPTLIYKKSNMILESARALAQVYDKSIIMN